MSVTATPLVGRDPKDAASPAPKTSPLEQQTKDRYREHAFVGLLHGPLREGLDQDAAADILFTIASPEVGELLVVHRHWPLDRLERWWAEILTALLLPTP
jgi:hypothetical protein